MDDDDDDTFDQDDFEIEVTNVAPLPWLHHDTVAASMVFASQIAGASAQLFMNLAHLAMGESGAEYEDMLKRQFVTDALADIQGLTEGGDDDGTGRVPATK